MMIASGAQAACTPQDFAVVGFKPGVHNACRLTPCPTYSFTGKLQNNCGQPAAAQLKLTAFTKDETVVSTYEAWPASTRNIAPGAKYAFDLGYGINYDPVIDHVTIEIIEVRAW